MIAAQPGIGNQLPGSTDSSRHFVGWIYERYDACLRGFLVNKLRNEADAEDVVQEVYLRLSRMTDHGNIRSDRAFIFATATNLLRDRSRRLATRLDRSSVSMDSADGVLLHCSSNDPAHRIQDGERLEVLRVTLETLGDNCRQAFWLSRIDGLTYAEIAHRMNVSVSMVEKHISNALSRLRAVM